MIITLADEHSSQPKWTIPENSKCTINEPKPTLERRASVVYESQVSVYFLLFFRSWVDKRFFWTNLFGYITVF